MLHLIQKHIYRHSTHWTIIQVEARVLKWKAQQQKKNQPCHVGQLQFAAEVVQYVGVIHRMMKINPSMKSFEKTTARVLPPEIPIYGPRFEPPTYLALRKRDVATDVKPDTSYVQPLMIIHPFYFSELARCSQYLSENIKWEGWNSCGYWDVHGLFHEETALGVQLNCKDCQRWGEERRKEEEQEKRDKIQHCFATTNVIFWEKKSLWDIPCEC